MMKRNGFTLIELLVVIAIIGVLASVTLASLGEAREQANVAKTVIDIREIRNRITIFLNHTNTYPADCLALCGPSNDPFLNSRGVAGWRGPYEGIWNLAHPWGGGYGVRYYETYQDGTFYMIIYIDDDRSFTASTDNQGRVPISALLKMDGILDDGNLATGDFVGDGRDTLGTDGGSLSVEGEGIWIASF